MKWYIKKAQKNKKNWLNPGLLDPTKEKIFTPWLAEKIEEGDITEKSDLISIYRALNRLYSIVERLPKFNMNEFKSSTELINVMSQIDESLKPVPNSAPQRDTPYRRTTREGFPSQQEVMTFVKRMFPEESPQQKLFKDRWGLHSDDPESQVKKMLLCTTATDAVKKQFVDGGYDLLISHHDNLIGVPQIILHSTMDFGDKGHNVYFADRIGLQNVSRIGNLSVFGTLPKTMNIKEFEDFLRSRGFQVKGITWENSKAKDKSIRTVVYCSGLGGLTLDGSFRKTPHDLSRFKADVFVTGELSMNPRKTPNKFKYIVELGHTPSEKPIFIKIKNVLQNRWQNMQIDLADEEADYFGIDVAFPRGENSKGIRRMAKKELIPGGKAKDKKPEDFDQDQLQKGIKVEMEHTDNPDLAKEIAMDHLEEFENYYEELDKMEEKLKEEKKSYSLKDIRMMKMAAALVAEDIETFEDRIRLNKRIRMLKMIATKLSFLRKAISQNPPGAQSLLQDIMKTKMFTSFPEYQVLLEDAHAVARDNYKKFSEICDVIIEKMYAEVRELENVRSKFVNKILPDKMKKMKESGDK